MTASLPVKSLLGTWVDHPLGPEPLRAYSRVTLDFRADGRLYRRAEKRQSGSVLTEVRVFHFRLENGLIVLRLSSPSREEWVGYLISPEGPLSLDLSDCPSTFIRKGLASAALDILARILAFV
jgi:hypothetical protein